MKKPETNLQQKIVRALEREVGGHWMKIHGSQFQTKGIPDLLGCVAGLFFALEVKCDSSKYGASDYQLYNIKQIHDSGGMAAVVESPEEAVELVKRHIKERALSAEERSKLIDDTLDQLEAELRNPNNNQGLDAISAPIHRSNKRVIVVPKELKEEPTPTASVAKKSPKVSNGNKLTLAELADQLGMEAKAVRRQLRKAYPNHKGSWSWEGDEIADVMGVVQSWS